MKFSPMVLAAISVIATSTAKAESWRCSYSPVESRPSSYIGFDVNNDLLVDDLYDTHYSLLQNNPNALLAETHYADYDPVLMTVTLFVETVMIDKISHRLTVTTTVIGSEVKQAVGSCQARAAIEAGTGQSLVTSKIIPR